MISQCYTWSAPLECSVTLLWTAVTNHFTAMPVVNLRQLSQTFAFPNLLSIILLHHICRLRVWLHIQNIIKISSVWFWNKNSPQSEVESLWILAVLHTCFAVSKADSSSILNTFRIYFSLIEIKSNKLNGKEDFVAMHQLTVKCRNCFLEFAPVCDNLRQLSAPTVTSLYQWLQLPPRFSFTQP